MRFCDVLKQYMSELDCSGKELAQYANLSPSLISRYRTGEKEPALDSDALKALSQALAQIALHKKLAAYTYDYFIQQFTVAITQHSFDDALFQMRFRTLCEALNISMKSLALYTNYEISFLYRLKSGQRKVHNPLQFASSVANYVKDNYAEAELLPLLSDLPGFSTEKLSREVLPSEMLCSKEVPSEMLCSKEVPSEMLFSKEVPSEESVRKADLYEALLSYLSLHTPKVPQPTTSPEKPNIQSFLEKIDHFNLDDYIRIIHFDELRVPTVPFHLKSKREYLGISQMRQGELDFFKSTVTSSQAQSIFMFSDMPITDMAKDMDFNRKWMFAIACAIKKGLRLDVIHHLDRPLEELILGLEAWVPIYMTGQVNPYYIPEYSAHIYHHLNYISEVAALQGECVQGQPDEGRYLLTNSKSDLSYFQKKKEQLLGHARPLMDIYTTDQKEDFADFLEKSYQCAGTRRHIWPSLPIYTISQPLLQEILLGNGIPDADIAAINAYRHAELMRARLALSKGNVLDEFYFPTKEEFDKRRLSLSLSGCFYHKTIYYTYEQYQKHYEETKQFSSMYDNHQIKTMGVSIFHNVRLTVLQHDHVIISKLLSPSIHFVIHHPVLVRAIQSMSYV